MFIIPRPRELTELEGRIPAYAFRIRCEENEIAGYAADFVKAGQNEEAAEIAPTDIIFTKKAEYEKEHYSISAKNGRIEVSYGTLESAYRAVSTLRQVIDQAEDGTISEFEIDDYPSIPNRGLMLDISRGKQPKMSELKQMIDNMAAVKYNQLQLYIDTFVFEFPNFKEYSEEMEPYTAKDLAEIEAYCAERFIRLVPTINGFGHMAAWTFKDEFSHLAIHDENGKPTHTLNPFKEESLALIDQIYDGYLDLFKSDLVNIGMDEPFDLGKGETKEACEKYGVGKVYTDYLNKVCALATKKYSKTPMFWSDIVFDHEEQLPNIPKNAIVMDWGYETEQHFDRNCRKLSELGLRYYVCPGTSMWCSFTGRSNNAMLNIMEAAECGEYYGAEGFLLTEWGDGGNPQFLNLSYLPIVFGAAMSWNYGSHRTATAYAERTKTMAMCKQYLDRYIYHTKKGDLADIVFRMGNYYLLEEHLKHNITLLTMYLWNPEKLTKGAAKGFARVADYMKDIRAELADVKADELCLREIKQSCDTVILFAETLSGEIKEESLIRLQAVREEFEELWQIRNKKPGMEIYGKMLSDTEAYIRRSLEGRAEKEK